MGGGGLSFLNKKTWHPARLDNQEAKWKKEQAALKEKQKADELRKQIVEEREREELDGLAHAAGVKEKSAKLDWMYQGGMVAKAEANKRVEEQQQAAQPVQPPQPSNVEKAVKLPTFYAEDTAASANEVWSRLHSDPLFAIKQQEIAARRTIASNPVQMDAIRKQVEARKAAEEGAKAAKKAEKRSKKEARRAEKAQRKAKKHGKEAPDVAEVVEDGHKSKKPRHSPHDADRRNDEDQHRKHRRDVAEDHRSGRDDRPHENGERHANGHSKHRDANGARPAIDGACAQRGDVKYGLNYGGDGPDEEARRERRAATQRNLEEAAKRKAQEEKEKAEQRYVRKEYKTGQLTAEERAQRLAEMTGNASVHDEARWSRQRRARAEDEAEEAANQRKNADEERHAAKAAAFLKTATQETYGAGGEAASLADRVGRRKYYSERGDAH